MSTVYDLIVKADADRQQADLRLRDFAGEHIQRQELRLAELPAAKLDAVFNLREHVQRSLRLGEAASADEMVVDTGVFLADKILGEKIFDRLAGVEPRTLRVQVDWGSDEENR